MFKELAILSMFVVAMVMTAPLEQHEPPMPYEFAFNEQNPNHTLTRQESGDPNGVVRGQYSFIDRDGRTRLVVYIADPIEGFSAEIQSNEPGLVSHSPANAVYNVQ